MSRISKTFLLLSLLTMLFSGCAEGMFASLGAYNPSVRRQWALEEQRYGPNVATQVAEIRDLRKSASRLQSAGREQASRNLAALLRKEKNLQLRVEATKTLGALPTETATKALHEIQKDGNARVRIAVCQAWALRADGEALHSLAEILGSDTDIDVQLAAARSLAKFHDPAAIKALGTALNRDDHPELQYRAIESLKTASGRDYGGDLVAWRQFVNGEEPTRQEQGWVDRLKNLF